MSERLTKRKEYGCACWNGDQNLVTHRRYLEMLDVMAKYEDVLYDADGNEVISLEELAQLLQSKREGRVVVLNEIFKTPTGQYGFIYYDKQGLMTGDFRDTKAESEAARALAATEPKGEATT